MHTGHRKRMKEKFLKDGFENFQDHEKLEFLLYNVIKQKNTNNIGHNLMNAFGSLSSVFDAPIEALTSVDGVGEASAILIKIIPEICRCYLEDKCNSKNKTLTSDNVGNLLVSKFVGRQNETVMLLLLDSKSKILFCGKVSEGSVNAAEIYVRKIIELAMKYNASQAIIAHNHPSGIALPSKDDIISTRELSKSLKLVGINLIDHIIVADDDYVSLAQSNLGEDLF